MIFYADIIKDFVDNAYVRMSTMMVYKGSQPSVAEYVTGVNSGIYKWAGSELLQACSDVQLTSHPFESTYRIELTLNSTSTKYYINQNTGAAQWAVLFHNSMMSSSTPLLSNPSVNSIEFARNITENDLFMIVPVSNNAGSGVLKFSTVDFDGSKNELDYFSLNFSG
jgi:hypothetical protein